MTDPTPDENTASTGSDDAVSNQTSAITIRGFWQGQPGDPARTFSGTVTDSNHPKAQAGCECQIVFEADGRRVTSPNDQGSYVLYTVEAGDRIVLSRFLNHAVGGAQPVDEERDADWYALAISS